MRVLLINPPQAHFTQPLLALPSLAAYLRSQGYPETTMIDASIEAYDDFLTSARLRRSLERIRASQRLAELDEKPELRFRQMEEYQQLSEIALSGEAIVEGIEEAKQVLRSPREFYDYERYLWAARTVEQGLRLFSAEYAPTRLTAHGFVMRAQIERSEEILGAIDNERENPYVEWIRERLMPRIRELNPDIVGISVTFGSQAIPAFTLAKQLKEWKPSVHITMGGGLLAYVAKKLSKRREIWSVLDTFVLLEGERPLLELCKAVEREKRGEARDWSRIGNLLYHDSATGEVVATPELAPLEIQSLPTPDFDGLPLHLYLSPELVLPLAITRGCYWGKCVFCTLYTVIGPGYRGRSIEQTVADIAALKAKYGTKHFYLVIEDLPPNMAKRLPGAILEAKLDIDWWCDARLEHDVFDQQTCQELAASGCKRIAFGYESASRRVLDRMCKGIDPDRSLQLVQRCHDAGISVTLYVMVGFPTETREEADLTLRTILAHREKIQEVSVRVFYLDETSEVFRRRQEFDIVEVYPDPKADLQVYYDFKAGSGMSRREARQMYLEFTRALRSHFPVFQNTNMLYHELKSHYFLYLAKHGSWNALTENVLDRTAAQGDLANRPRARARVRSLPLRFDRGAIDQRLTAVDSATVRPRYQSDLLDEEDRERFDRDLAPQAPSDCVLVYDLDAAETQALSPAAFELLRRCDGLRSEEEIVEIIPAPYRDDARHALRALAAAGLLERSSPGLPASVRS